MTNETAIKDAKQPVESWEIPTERRALNEIALEDVTKPDTELGQILVDSGVRQWRSNCQVGQFTIGSSTMHGNKLDMELVGAQISEGEYFGYPRQKWLALLFIDQEGVLSSILFKTESLDQFDELRRTYRLKGETLLGKTIRASMVQRSGKAKDPNTGEKIVTKYYAVEFEVVKQGKYAEVIAQFRQMQYSPQLFRLLESPKPETESNNSNSTNSNGKKAK